MKTYLIDGNNLIHKIRDLSSLQKKDPQSAREKLAHRIDSCFIDKKVKILLFYDGFEGTPVRTKIKIKYSEKATADDKIRQTIENSRNPLNTVVVTSDEEIRNLAKAYSCTLMTSSEFARFLRDQGNEDEEEKKIRDLRNSSEEFKKLFGSDD